MKINDFEEVQSHICKQVQENENKRKVNDFERGAIPAT